MCHSTQIWSFGNHRNNTALSIDKYAMAYSLESIRHRNKRRWNFAKKIDKMLLPIELHGAIEGY